MWDTKEVIYVKESIWLTNVIFDTVNITLHEH